MGHEGRYMEYMAIVHGAIAGSFLILGMIMGVVWMCEGGDDDDNHRLG